MDETDFKLLAVMQNGILLTVEPFKEIALAIGITQQEVMTRLKRLKQEGVIRRFGASIRPNTLGFTANALVAWKIPQNRVQEVGTYLSRLPEISHCYERKSVAGKWEYNLYTVIHARESENIERLVTQISTETEIDEYKILYSIRDLKTISNRVDCPLGSASTPAFPNSENRR